jgi:transcriptional repressor NrdR
MRCPSCGNSDTQVLDTSRDASGGIRRRRCCKQCQRRFTTVERVVESMPLVVKRGGRREAFSREKIADGVRVACAKRPVAAEAIERMVSQVEAQVLAMNRSEVPAREIGDFVLRGLRDLDEVAYIRYAIVYLNLKDLESVRGEIDKLVSER